MMAIVKPFFVYGTLMEGFRNHEALVLGKAEKIIQGSVENHYLRHFPAGYPGMYQVKTIEERLKTVIGEIIFPKHEFYRILSDNLDILEGYQGPNDPNNMYERTEVKLKDADGKTFLCDTYICLLDESKGQSIGVDNYDWKSYMKNKGLKDAGKDWANR